MAENNLDVDYSGPLRPEKVVIVAGPSFGTAMSFVLLGMALGAAGALYVINQRGGLPPAAGGDAVAEGLTGGGAKAEAGAARMMARLSSLARRVKSLSGRVKEVAQQAGETIGPVLSDAVAEAKNVARASQQKLEEDLSREPDIRPDAVADEQA